MKPNQLKELKALILNSINKQKEFKILEGPLPGILGMLVFDSSSEVRNFGTGVVFGILVKNELGEALIHYGVFPKNINDASKDEPFGINNGYITFRGTIFEIPNDNSLIKKEKYQILPAKTEINVTFNDETRDGTIRLLGVEIPELKKMENKHNTEITQTKKVEPQTTEEILKEKAEKFRNEWNTKTSDWIFNESELYYEPQKILIVAFCREYAVHSDQNAYSMVYVFCESEEPSRIYYDKFWDAQPEWRNAGLFIKKIISVSQKGKFLEISTKTENEESKILKVSL